VTAVMNPVDVEVRARQTRGESNDAIYGAITRALSKRGVRGHALVDVGCGAGRLWPFLRDRFARYVGIDVIPYEQFPKGAIFRAANLDAEGVPLPDQSADVVVAAETIEHLENPRAFMRELVRVTKADGWIVVTTPNQLSLLSLITLFVKARFSAFQDVHYPAHITALLPVDLRRIAEESGVTGIAIEYTEQGRVPLTGRHYPACLARLLPQALSDNVLLLGKRPSLNAQA
jgi:2-polyprenyl-3-methyl-5-hydroxy-6-metoxy-1,4-benzoquinol methylase